MSGYEKIENELRLDKLKYSGDIIVTIRINGSLISELLEFDTVDYNTWVWKKDWWEGEEKPTAVDVVRRNNEIGNNRWYSLDGRQLQQHPVEKGIYLKNGKKYIVK